jgi:hypothetical protein
MKGGQNGGGPQNISSRVKFNDEYSLLYRIISGAIEANYTLGFVRGTWLFTSKVTAIWPEKKHGFPLRYDFQKEEMRI